MKILGTFYHFLLASPISKKFLGYFLAHAPYQPNLSKTLRVLFSTSPLPAQDFSYLCVEYQNSQQNEGHTNHFSLCKLLFKNKPRQHHHDDIVDWLHDYNPHVAQTVIAKDCNDHGQKQHAIAADNPWIKVLLDH